MTTALRKAKRVRLGFENGGETLDSKRLVIDTELIRYKWGSTIGTYPDYEKVIPTEFVAEARFDTRDMLRASASLGALYLDRDTAIIIAIKDGMMTLSVKDDKGEAHIEAQAEAVAEAVEIVEAEAVAEAETEDKPKRKRKAKEPVAVA